MTPEHKEELKVWKDRVHILSALLKEERVVPAKELRDIFKIHLNTVTSWRARGRMLMGFNKVKK